MAISQEMLQPSLKSVWKLHVWNFIKISQGSMSSGCITCTGVIIHKCWSNTEEYGQHQPILGWGLLNTLRPRQNGRHFADDTFKCIFLNENVRILIKISLKFVPMGPINNIPALVQIMAWRRPGDKPLSDAMMVSLLTHICVTRAQWVEVPSLILIYPLGTFFILQTYKLHTFDHNDIWQASL